jgi:hypothetical protein
MQSSPMSSEEQKITLIMQRNYLSALKFGHRWERGLEHSSDEVT